MMNKVDLFIDSGAFSAYTQKIEIDIQEYIKFIKRYQKYIGVYAVLDVIGDAERTLQNQKIMEDAGLNPIPCYHYGEDIKYLKNYLKYDYIALGGMVGRRADLVGWLNSVFGNYICDEKGIPKIKVHGFGLTSLKLMMAFPWYSVDSTSWVVTSRLGAVYVPRYRDGKWIYDENSWKVNVSSKSPSQSEAGEHINNYTPIQKKMILDYFKDKGYGLGKSVFEMRLVDSELKENEKWSEKKVKGMKERQVEIIVERGLCNDYKLRDEMNIIYFQDLEKTFPKYPWAFKIESVRKGLGV